MVRLTEAVEGRAEDRFGVEDGGGIDRRRGGGVSGAPSRGRGLSPSSQPPPHPRHETPALAAQHGHTSHGRLLRLRVQ